MFLHTKDVISSKWSPFIPSTSFLTTIIKSEVYRLILTDEKETKIRNKDGWKKIKTYMWTKNQIQRTILHIISSLNNWIYNCNMILMILKIKTQVDGIQKYKKIEFWYRSLHGSVPPVIKTKQKWRRNKIVESASSNRFVKKKKTKSSSSMYP